MDKVFFHNNKIVPFVETVHNRLNIEVARGCVGRCRFCQASKYYRPWRARKVETILNLLDESLKNTGYEEVLYNAKHGPSKNKKLFHVQIGAFIK